MPGVNRSTQEPGARRHFPLPAVRATRLVSPYGGSERSGGVGGANCEYDTIRYEMLF